MQRPVHANRESSRGASVLSQVQGWFYLVTGIWPLLAGTSFQRVTGFKVDFWLAQTVGVLLAISGLILILAGRRGRVTPEIKLMALLQAGSLAVADVYCIQKPNTTPVYLVDALAEIGLVIAWLFVWRSERVARS